MPTLKYPSAASYVTQLQMLFTPGDISAYVIAPPGSRPTFNSQGVKIKLYQMPDVESFHDSIAVLRTRSDFRLVQIEHTHRHDSNAFITYRIQSPPTDSEFHTLLASEFINSVSSNIVHLNISKFDVPIERFLRDGKTRFLRSLDLSRMGITDVDVKKIASSNTLRKLCWLDLSGNQKISIDGVEWICKGVRDKSLAALIWLELLGTDCDATPYIDGHYWRMTDYSRQLAKVYGYQRWMMLGSRLPSMANKEVLSSAQRDVNSLRVMRSE